ESSLAAFEVSIRRQQQFQQRFYDMLVNHERLLDSATNRRLLALEALEDDTATDDIEAIIASLPEADIRDYDLRAIRRELSLDMQTLDAILDMVALVQRLDDEQKRDAKLAEVKRLLSEDLRGRKVLLFSYYRDTARYVYEAIVGDPAWQESWSSPPVIEVIHGETDPHRRENLVKRFAPKANTTEDNPPPISEADPEIDILISTDVLSEGQNLQDAGVIINYDLHWTPIRMIQRAGRIDRLGTEFDTLHVFNCFPQTGLEQLLRLVERLQDRIRDIDRTVGLDASILGEVVSSRSLDQLRRLHQEDQSVIDELEREIELVSTDEMKLPLILYLQQAGLEKVKSIPLGIGSGIAKSLRPSGVFFAFQAADRHFWRLYTADEVISDKRRLYRYLMVDPNEPRSIPAGFEVYDLLDQAINDVLQEISSAIRARRVKPKLGKINIELDAALRQPTLLTSAEIAAQDDLVAPEGLRQKVQQVLQSVSLDAFRRDKTLKTILSQYRDDQNQRALVEALDEFFVENELYRDVIMPKTTLEQIRTEDLQLVAYEVFG
ncbi:MAG: helicase-related protein, partial [Anaerolineaceae bacterium]